jgi:Fe-S cluster biosynthesis and repair protein YggX
MDSQERLRVFTNMAEADPTNELAHFSLGKVHLELEHLAEAEGSLRRVLELNPRHSQAHRLLGEALLRLGRRDEGIRVLEEGISVAHEKGEFQPRNQMQETLRREGIEPPRPEATKPDATREGAKGFTCRRCGKENAPLEEPPFLNDLGKEIQETICQACWREWFAMSIKVINEYRLNLLSPQGNSVYESHMKEFLGLDG